jgi:thiol-disulfide isomerase/thioredoxin
MNYIQTNTSNKDLASFLNILYLKELIISPSYWLNHDSIFNSKVLEQALKDEVNNPYYGIIDETANSYFAAQAGQSAYNFTIEDMNGEIKILSDFTGKLLYIDNWATWCGPCINERKNVQELAANFKNNPMVEILMISTDRQKEKWIDFLKDDPEFNNIDYHIIEAELEDYIDAFNVSFLPKYILINENGKIIDANASQPSLGLKQYIEDYIKQM